MWHIVSRSTTATSIISLRHLLPLIRCASPHPHSPLVPHPTGTTLIKEQTYTRFKSVWGGGYEHFRLFTVLPDLTLMKCRGIKLSIIISTRNIVLITTFNFGLETGGGGDTTDISRTHLPETDLPPLFTPLVCQLPLWLALIVIKMHFLSSSLF